MNVSDISRRLKLNSAFSVAEVCVNGLSLFLMYKVILTSLGVAQLGLWSIIVSTTSIARFGDIGASAGLGRFVSISIRDKDFKLAAKYIETAIVVNVLLFLIVSTAAYIPAAAAISAAIPKSSLPEALQILPYALFSFFLMNITLVIFSGLSGMQSNYAKSIITIIGTFLFVTASIILTPQMGLRGIAIGQIVQYIFCILSGWCFTSLSIPGAFRVIIPYKIDANAIKQLIGLGARLQISNLVSFLFEPAVKFTLSFCCGLVFVGYYEMASRYVFQVRSIVAAPFLNLVPAYTHFYGEDQERVKSLYTNAVCLGLFVGGLMFLATAAFSPVLSIVWTRHLNITFVAMTGLLCLAWFVNAISAPAYLLGVAKGRIKWNLAGHAIMTVTGPLLGIVCSRLAGPLGFVAGASFSLALGSALSALMNCYEDEIDALPAPRVIISRMKSNFRNLLKIAT